MDEKEIERALKALRDPHILYLSKDIRGPAIKALQIVQEHQGDRTIDEKKTTVNMKEKHSTHFLKTNIALARLQEYQLEIGMSKEDSCMFSRSEVLRMLHQLEKDMKSDAKVKK